MKTLIVVDIQPEYEEYFGWDITDFINFVEEFECNRIIVLYNGKRTLDMIEEEKLKEWYLLNGSETLQDAIYIDKGYAFFRDCMDHGFSDDVIIPCIKYMWENDITDSRDIDWDDLKDTLGRNILEEELIEFLEREYGCLFIPDLMDIINRIPGDLYLVGGGIDLCLKEVALALQTLEREYTIISDFTY